MRVKEAFSINPPKNNHKYTDFINYFDTSSVKDGKIVEVDYLEDEFPSRAKRLIKKEDILYSSVRPILKHYLFYNENYEHAVASTGFLVLRNKSKSMYDTRFVYYYLATDNIVNYLHMVAESSQSTFPACSNKDIGKIELPNYRLDYQRKVSKVLSNYDDLIEINNKRIKTIESTIETIYREWFVRFRFPNYEKAKFENGIPANWEFKRFKEICSYKRGASYSSEEIESPDFDDYLINLKNLRDYGGFRKDNFKTFNGKYKEFQKVSKFDLIMAITEMVQDRRIIGYTGLVPTYRNNCIISSDLIKIVSKFDNMFLYSAFTFSGASLCFSQYGNGTNVIHLKPDAIRNVKVLIPPLDLINQYVKLVKPMFEEIDLLHLKNENLLNQRNVLLPRLMNGKLSIEGKEIL